MAASSVCSPAVGVLPPLHFPTTPLVPKNNQICGRLVHPNGEPIRSKRVEIDRGFFLTKIRFTTDENGYFRHTTRGLKRNSNGIATITYDVFERNVFRRPWSLDAHQIKVDSVPVNVAINSKGNWIENVVAKVYEYQNQFPDLQQPKDFDMRPQHWPYLFNLVTASFDEALRLIYSKLSPFKTVEEVQNAFKPEVTYVKVSSEATIDMLLNGIFPCNFLNGPENTLKVDINWDEFQKKQAPQLPNVSITLTNEDGKLDIISVRVQLLDGTFKLFNKGDADFDKGLYLFNCAAMLKGEVVSHLTNGHFWTGQCAMANFRSLSDQNPVKKFLSGFLKGVLEINRIGATAIFGEGGILDHSGLTVAGVMQMVKKFLGGLCYKTFRPRVPINDQDRFAHAGNLFWGILKKVVDDFVDENEALIRKYWNEIYTMSHNLTANSPEYRPLDDVHNYNDWYRPNEIDDPSVPGRVSFNGEVKSVRPITMNPNEPDEGDLDNLKQFMCMAVYMGSFWHAQVHGAQSSLSNLNLGSIAPNNNGEGPFGGIKVEDAVAELSLVHILLDFRGDSIIDNVYGDMPKKLIAALLEHEEEFKNLGVVIRALPPGTVI